MVHPLNSNASSLPKESFDIRSCTERRDAILTEMRNNNVIINKKIAAISFLLGLPLPNSTPQTR